MVSSTGLSMGRLKRFARELHDIRAKINDAARRLDNIHGAKQEYLERTSKADSLEEKERFLASLQKTLRDEDYFLRKLSKALKKLLTRIADVRTCVRKLKLAGEVGRETEAFLKVAEELGAESMDRIKALRRIHTGELKHLQAAEGKHLLSPDEFDPKAFQKLRRDLQEEHERNHKGGGLQSTFKELKRQYVKVSRLPSSRKRTSRLRSLFGFGADQGLMRVCHPILGALAWAVVALSPEAEGVKKEDLR